MVNMHIVLDADTEKVFNEIKEDYFKKYGRKKHFKNQDLLKLALDYFRAFQTTEVNNDGNNGSGADTKPNLATKENLRIGDSESPV